MPPATLRAAPRHDAACGASRPQRRAAATAPHGAALAPRPRAPPRCRRSPPPARAEPESAPATPSWSDFTAAAAPAQPSKRTLGEGNSTWTETEHWAKEGQDVLYQLGQQSSSMRIDMGARAGLIDDLFVGKFLGRQADIASGELRPWERRTLAHLIGDYYVPPRFLDAVSLHLVKNHLAEAGRMKGVPLILGIWGAKGSGKSFQVELVCKKMGVQPIIMSAGELEDEYAGEPGKRLRERYRAASQTIKNSGIMSCLVINDLDAGCGRFKHTQVTVNNQIVMGTLMNLCDHPERASLGESWREDKTLRRVPIIITGNDLSTLYAPLLRDGRMSKFYWEPDRTDMEEMMFTLYRDDGLTRQDVRTLLDAFPGQTLDFFGALRARQHDALIREWAASLDEKELSKRLRAAMRYATEADAAERDKEATPPTRPEGLPDFGKEGGASLDLLLAAGHDLAREQEEVNSHKLSEDYMKKQSGGASLIGFG